jgi:ribonuclease T1
MRSVRTALCLIVALVATFFLPFAAARSDSPGFSPARDAAIGTIAQAELPPEARATLELIRKGGPFRYRQDGSVFQNRERRLPSQPAGYYREYTVPTPGSPDRGARRIIAGESPEYFYTSDHYRSFRRIQR